MQLNQTDKQKFLEYLEKRRGEFQNKQFLEAGISLGEPVDIFSFCTQDILEKLSANSYYNDLDFNKQLNLKINLANKILQETLKKLFLDIKTLDEEVNKEYVLTLSLLENFNLESFFERLNLILASIPELGERFSENVVLEYLEFCKKFSIGASHKILPIVTQIDQKLTFNS